MIRRGRWSLCYKQDNVFIKEYLYPDLLAIQRETSASRVVQGAGIRTPGFIDTVECGGKTCSVFEYCDIEHINYATVLDVPKYLEQVNGMLNAFGKIQWDCNDAYWFRQLEEFDNVLGFVYDDTSRLLDYLRGLELNCFVHGDFTCDNIGRVSDDIIVYDFQHASLGPAGWDKAYFAATVPPQKCSVLGLDAKECEMAFVISAIRYGRGLRKSSVDLSERESLYCLWKDCVKW